MNKDETLFKFPCEFPIKILGKANADFEILVLSIIRKHVSDLSENAITTRLSKDQTYLAITVTITATSKEQLDALYSELSVHKDIMWVL